MEFSKWQNIFVILFMSAILTSGLAFIMKDSKITLASQTASISDNTLTNTTSPSAENTIPLPPPPPQKLTNPPAVIKAIYATGYSAGTKRFRNYLTEVFSATQINAVVVDIKGSDGYVTYASQAPEVVKYKLNYNAISDIDDLVRFLHDKNVYVIGRIAVFEDPVYSKAHPEWAIYNKLKSAGEKRILWKDNNNLGWMDPASKDVWNYDVSLAKDALAHGFDEINFDYVRFPTDGKAEAIGFPVYDEKTAKADVIKSFFQYLRSNLQGEKISADIFGQITTNKDDMGIGQLLENAFENFDYVCPMAYPSHYINGFLGYKNPAEHPYQVVKFAMEGAKTREADFLAKNNGEAEGTPASESVSASRMPLAKFRPWLQDFNMGAIYNSPMVQQQIMATEDGLGADYNGFMLWNPNNVYTQGAVLRPN